MNLMGMEICILRMDNDRFFRIFLKIQPRFMMDMYHPKIEDFSVDFWSFFPQETMFFFPPHMRYLCRFMRWFFVKRLKEKTPTIWGWFLEPIYDDTVDGLYLGLLHCC